ncbi:MAG: prepilin-type N-terminal cleavage/methylation domain-containing protein [Planctomycetales bacterium]|nr:prepilin-type N-terminal cleavage/methylation domain-containing protein [Planctomycetales bacterium]
MTNPKDARKASRGLTLTELLVVIAIIVLVSGAMLPMVRPLLKGRNVREAARIVNVFFAGVQSQAVEKRRPMGVWLERADHTFNSGTLAMQPDNYKVYKLYTAEQPLPYTGDSLDARARVVTAFEQYAGLPDFTALQPFVPGDFATASVLIPFEDCAFFSTIQVGELIQFNNRGGLYQIIRVPQGMVSIQHDPSFRPPLNRQTFGAQSAGSYVVLGIRAVESDQPLAAPTLPRLRRRLGRLAGQTVPFKIFRRPRRTMTPPIEMPNGTTIDLMLSGIDDDTYGASFSPSTLAKFRYPNGLEVPPTHDIVIMFDEFGQPDQIHYMVHDPVATPMLSSASRKVNSTVSLFIGRDELVAQNGLKEIPQIGQLVLDTDPTVAQVPWAEANLNDTTNIWMSISGSRITNAPNAGIAEPLKQFPFAPMSPYVFFDDHIRHARQLTRSGLSMGEQ